MRNPFRHALLVVSISAAVSVALAAHDPQEHQHPATHPAEGAHRHPQAAKLKNPVAPDATSIAAGGQLYDKHCAGCHGDTGKGDGSMGEELNPKPANLVDADWKHGSTDGEIFTLIRDGARGTGMKAYSRKLTTHQVWDVVNYIRSIGPTREPLTR
jgi:mono/diheme cytochrome c family protein